MSDIDALAFLALLVFGSLWVGAEIGKSSIEGKIAKQCEMVQKAIIRDKVYECRRQQ